MKESAKNNTLNFDISLRAWWLRKKKNKFRTSKESERDRKNTRGHRSRMLYMKRTALYEKDLTSVKIVTDQTNCISNPAPNPLKSVTRGIRAQNPSRSLMRVMDDRQCSQNHRGRSSYVYRGLNPIACSIWKSRPWSADRFVGSFCRLIRGITRHA